MIQSLQNVDWLTLAGTFCLGNVVIWLVRLFAVQVKTPTVTWLMALLSALLGGTALAFLGHFSKEGVVWPHEYWGYSIGLAVGLFLLSDAVQKQVEYRG